MSAVEDRLPAVADEAAAPSNDAACAEALAALEAELTLQDEQFQRPLVEIGRRATWYLSS